MGSLKRFLFDTFIAIARRYGEAILDRKSVPLHGRLLYGIGCLGFDLSVDDRLFISALFGLGAAARIDQRCFGKAFILVIRGRFRFGGRSDITDCVRFGRFRRFRA